MSTLQVGTDSANLADSVPFAIGQALRASYTAMPGIVTAYDPATQRASVQPALDAVNFVGPPLQRPVIHDVPVIFPSGGGYTLVLPVQEGDAVMLVWSMRDMTRFKESLQRAPALVGQPMPGTTPVALPGFGSAATVPAVENAATLQANGGSHWMGVGSRGVGMSAPDAYIVISDGKVSISAEEIEIKSAGDLSIEAEGKLSVKADKVSFDADRVEHGRANIGKDHKHRHVAALHPRPGPPSGVTTKPLKR